MTIQLNDTEMIYLYGNLKKELNNLKLIKPKTLAKTDIEFHEAIISSLESAMPQLKHLPL